MNKTKRLVFISVYVAIALVLDYIKSFIPFLNMASGGSINIALIPIALASFQFGIGNGVLVGLLWWLISSMLGLNPYYLNFIQYILDYIVPSCIVGVASIFYHKKKIFEVQLGILFTMFIRTLSIIISGAFYWSEYGSGSIAAFNFSVIYNLPYSIGTTIMLMIVIPLLIKANNNKVL